MEFLNKPSSCVILFIWIASPLAWIMYGVWRSRSAGLTHAPRRQVPWGMIDIVILYLVLFLAMGFLFVLLKSVYGIDASIRLEDLRPNDRATLLATSAGASLAATFVALSIVRVRNRASLIDLGIDWRFFRDDLAIGLAAFVLIAGPVFLIQRVLVLLWPSKHPLIELVMNNPDPAFFAVSAFSALLVAPLAEEFTYRVILQGWMERVVTHRGDPMPLLLGGHADAARSDGKNEKQLPVTAERKSADECKPTNSAPPTSNWPIVASAAIFALMHWGHGPDPIPLFVFALGLGYLYQRTHRVLPCIIVHFLLNAVSLTALLLDVYGAKA